MPEYHVTFPRPWTRHAEVEVVVRDVTRPVTFWMPTWTPGSYMIREFARNVRRVRATDGEGRPLRVRRLDKSRLEVDARGADSLRLGYALFANELTVRTSYVDEHQALLNGYSAFLAVEGREAEPHRVRLDTPSGWGVAVALPTEAVDGGARVVAADYHELGDSPIQCGVIDRVDFIAAGRPHAFAIVGGGNYDRDRLADVARRLVESAAALFGDLPYDEYLFLLQSAASGGGGLEHASSSVLQFPRHDYVEPKRWHDLVTLISHEHFHVWNVKRIQPAEYRPYDLSAETYSAQLWVCEGITSYYDELLPVRAGVVDEGAYLERLGEQITRFRELPGRTEMSLEEASLTAWTRLYRPDADTPNSAVSYYQKGALVALALDAAIRDASGDARDLDDVMRAAHERFGPGTAGFTASTFEGLCAELSGTDLSSFFDAAVRGTAELELEGALRGFGVRLEEVDREGGATLRDLIGARVPKDAALPRIDAVERGSPAEDGGLAPGDELIAVAGDRVASPEAARKRLGERAGEEVVVAAFRDDRLIERTVRPRAGAGRVWRCRADAAATAAAARRRAAWLGRGARE